MLSIKNLSFRNKNKNLITDLNLEIKDSQNVAIVGLNGAGKTTLLNLLSGELKATKGQIYINKQTLYSEQVQSKIGRLKSGMQGIERLNVLEYLAMCCQLKNIPQEQIISHIDQVCQKWHLNEIIDLQMNNLSQGNMQKVAIAQSFLNNPELILLDEPSQALDPIEQKRFIDNLTHNDSGSLVLFSSHHINEMVEAADSVLLLNEGKKIAYLSLKDKRSFWVKSSLDKPTLESKAIKGCIIELVYAGANNLYRYMINQPHDESSDNLEIKNELEQLISEPEVTYLGNSSEALLPLFQLVANREL